MCHFSHGGFAWNRSRDSRYHERPGYVHPGADVEVVKVKFRHIPVRGLIAVLAAGALATGCTPDTDPGSTPTPSPSVPQASPTASPSPTRTESPEEQKQREAFEAAEKAYRANWAESGRLSMAGGADKPTQVLLDTSKGSYLDDTMLSLRGIKENKLRASGPGKISWVRHGGYSATKITLRTCEDYRNAVLRKKNGDVYTPEGTRVYDQTIDVVLTGGTWKLSDQDTQEVKSC